MNNYQKDLEWSSQYLNDSEINVELIADTDYSTVIKLISNGEVYYLKKNHENFNYEDEIVSYLFEKNLNKLNVIARNKNLNSFLTKYAGESIYNVVESKYEIIIDSFINIQKNTKINELEEIGLRIFKEPQINYLCNKYSLEKKYKKDIINKWQIIEQNLLLTIEHGDFHLGNILILNDDIVFIDLAETTITTPLFSTVAFINTLNYRGKFTVEQRNKAKKYWLEKYTKEFNIKQEVIDNMYILAESIFPIYYLFGQDCLLQTSSSKNMQEKINTKIFNVLGTLQLK